VNKNTKKFFFLKPTFYTFTHTDKTSKMKDLFIEGSDKSPQITLSGTGTIKIAGRSIHEDPDEFYLPVVAWVEKYCDNPASETIVDVELEYINSGSAIFILSIIKHLVTTLEPDYELTINWYYEDGDDDILERGQYYSSLLQKDFVFIREG